jgi:acetylornithine deacetylase/succinyl-diaminopimelate desuccinylase-like protein
MDPQQTRSAIDPFWEQSILPSLARYIEIPNQSQLFDPEWKAHGHMVRAVEHVRRWVAEQGIAGARLEVFQDGDRSPVLLLEVAGDGDHNDTVLLYGHLDKQPPMAGWAGDLGPWKPVFRDGKLYGRGGADDGYAIYAIVAAIKALQAQGAEHARLVALIECGEESGSPDLPHYVNKLADRIGTPRLVICLDSGCGNYEQLWNTTSLRGMSSGELKVEILTEGVHSGSASGIVPSSFRILRLLLDRLEDSSTGLLKPDWLRVEIPDHRVREAEKTAAALGRNVFGEFPFVEGASPADADVVELLLRRTWRPTLSVTGQSGIPNVTQAGSVLRPCTSLVLSIRLPPTLRADEIGARMKTLLESDPPYGARVTFEVDKAAAGWAAPALAPWLAVSMEKASVDFFGKPACAYGEGGTIPFMGMLGEKFPHAQFVITGVLGPKSNAHGPNEFLHIQTAKNVTACVAHILADFSAR